MVFMVIVLNLILTVEVPKNHHVLIAKEANEFAHCNSRQAKNIGVNQIGSWLRKQRRQLDFHLW